MTHPIRTAEPGRTLADDLLHRLNQLIAMRDCAARLMARDRLGRDFFPRGEPLLPSKSADLAKLVAAYERAALRRPTPTATGAPVENIKGEK